MELQSSNSKELVYVVSETHQDFLNYVRDNTAYECIFIESGFDLRSRCYGKIAMIGNYQNRWNWVDIKESIERFEEDHKVQIESNRTVEEGDIDYGSGFSS